MREQATDRSGRGRRLTLLGGALPLAVLAVMPASNAALAQDPPPPPPGDDALTLVNAAEDFVERRRGGRFIARPVFDREVDRLCLNAVGVLLRAALGPSAGRRACGRRQAAFTSTVMIVREAVRFPMWSRDGSRRLAKARGYPDAKADPRRLPAGASAPPVVESVSQHGPCLRLGSRAAAGSCGRRSRPLL